MYIFVFHSGGITLLAIHKYLYYISGFNMKYWAQLLWTVIFSWRCEMWDSNDYNSLTPTHPPTTIFIAHRWGLHTDSIACPTPTAEFSLYTQSCKRKFIKIANRLICRFFVYIYINSIYVSLKSNRKLFTNEHLNVDRRCSRCVFKKS